MNVINVGVQIWIKGIWISEGPTVLEKKAWVRGYVVSTYNVDPSQLVLMTNSGESDLLPYTQTHTVYLINAH